MEQTDMGQTDTGLQPNRPMPGMPISKAELWLIGIALVMILLGLVVIWHENAIGSQHAAAARNQVQPLTDRRSVASNVAFKAYKEPHRETVFLNAVNVSTLQLGPGIVSFMLEHPNVRLSISARLDATGTKLQASGVFYARKSGHLASRSVRH